MLKVQSDRTHRQSSEFKTLFTVDAPVAIIAQLHTKWQSIHRDARQWHNSLFSLMAACRKSSPTKWVTSRTKELDYELRGGNIGERTKNVDSSGNVVEIKSGAYQSYERGKGNKGEKSDISCACHWTVNNAAANNIGTMYGSAYAVTPGGIMVPKDSSIEKPEDLIGKEIAVGYQSGSHYATI